MFKFLAVLFFSLFSFATFAQSPGLNIIRVNADKYCLGTELSIDVAVNGTFPPGNKFTVVAYRNWNDPAQRWEYPAELRGDKLVTVLKEPALANSETFVIKVLTSSPQSEIDVSDSYRALTKASVKLTTRWGYQADTINSTDQIQLVAVTNPSTPGTATLSAGDTIDLMYAWSWPTPYGTMFSLPKTKAGTYSIKEASNVCGPMAIEGQVNIKINPVDFMPVAISPEEPCVGGEIKVIFDTEGGEFNANTKFKIRFVSDNISFGTFGYRDAPATLSGKNQLTAKVPDNLTGNPLYIGIVAENPSAVSINKALKVYVHEKASFALQIQQPAINLGESTHISVNPKGRWPFKTTLSNGEVVEFSLNVSPQKTTSYQVKTFESGCGVMQNPPNAPVTLTVRPSLLLVGPLGLYDPIVACEGQTVRVGFRAVGVSAQTTYSVEIINSSDRKFSIPARVTGDSLEFTIPKNTSQDRDLSYDEIRRFRAVAANPALSSPSIPLTIQSPPTMVLADNAKPNVQYPSAARLDFDIRGGYPFTIELVNGSKEIYDYRNVWFEQFVKRDTIFKAAKLSNVCFTNPNPPAFPIKVANSADATPSLFARLIGKDPYCMGDSVEVELAISGKFEAGNVFTLSYLRDAQSTTYPIQNVTKPGNYTVKLPVQAWTYDVSLQLSSTLPRLISETRRFGLINPPSTPTISPVGTKENPVTMYLGESPRAVIGADGNSPVVYSLDGAESRVVTRYNGSYEIPLALQHDKTSEFKIKSSTNVCGIWNGEVTSYFRGIGYKLVIDGAANNIWHCAGSDADIRFSFEGGKALPGTKFTFQISATGDPNSYTDIASATDSQVIRFVTPDLPAGGYYTRIYSSDDIYSQPRNLLIGQAPTAKLAISYPTRGDTAAAVEYGKPVYIGADLTGNGPWGVMYSDGEQQQVRDAYASYAPVITGPQTFTISKVWNSCGYGTASGKVNVTIKPGLEMSKFPANAEQTICPGQKIQLDFAVRGMELPGNKYVVFSISDEKGVVVKLDSANRSTGRIQLTIPGGITGGRFYIKAEVASLQLSASLFYLLYATPDITLTGDNTITAGETTSLLVRSNTAFGPNTAFELSDGKTYINTRPYPGGVMEIKVSPAVTTTYTIKPLQSTCGAGKVSGSATITVQPKLAQWLSIQRVEGLRRQNVCGTDTIRVDFYHVGHQGTQTDYEVLLSDSTGKNFVPIPTTGQSSPVIAIIPAGMRQSAFYRLRLNAKDPKVSGSTYAGTLRIGERARAKVLTPSVAYQAGQPVNVMIGLEGTSPFYYRFGDDNFFRYRSTARFADTIVLAPVTPLAIYKISELTNECGPGTIDEPSSFTVELVTATEPVGEVVTFGPNPVADALSVKFEGAALRQLEMINAAGQRVFAGKYTGRDATVDLSAFPAGIYLLQIRKKQNVATYRIVKY